MTFHVIHQGRKGIIELISISFYDSLTLCNNKESHCISLDIRFLKFVFYVKFKIGPDYCF